MGTKYRHSKWVRAPQYMAVHEAAHAVFAVKLGGFAEGINLIPEKDRLGGCEVSWPKDGQDMTRQRLLTCAAGPAATAIYTRWGQDFAITYTGMGDLRKMDSLGDTSDELFKEARKLCRRWWPSILAVARAAQANDVLSELDILVAMTPAKGRMNASVSVLKPDEKVAA